MQPVWRHQEALLNGVRLHFVEAGEGPLVVLLHGFPEFWYSWRYQVPALADAGFRVVAPDMRGYNLSEKPPGVHSYRMTHLVDDVAALIAHFGAGRAAVVGHDWGGVVAWSMPVYHPEVVDRVAVLNAPHPAAMFRELQTPAQMLRSWYVFFFQLPGVPEALLSAGGHAAVAAIARYAGRGEGHVTDEDVRLYVEAASRPGALSAAVNYYRAAVRALLGVTAEDAAVRARAFDRSDAPSLLIWGDRDPVLGPSLTEGLGEWVPDLRVVHVPEAGHSVQIEAFQAVNRELAAFLSVPGTASA